MARKVRVGRASGTDAAEPVPRSLVGEFLLDALRGAEGGWVLHGWPMTDWLSRWFAPGRGGARPRARHGTRRTSTKHPRVPYLT